MQNTFIKDSSAVSSVYAAICKYCKEKALANILPLQILLLPRCLAVGTANWSQAHASICCTELLAQLCHCTMEQTCSTSARPAPALCARMLPTALPCQTGWQRGFIIVYETEGYPVGIRRTLKITSVCDSSRI